MIARLETADASAETEGRKWSVLASALGELRAAEGVDALATALPGADPDTKEHVAYALGAIGDPRAVPALAGELESHHGNYGDPNNATAILDALHELGTPEAYRAIFAYRKSLRPLHHYRVTKYDSALRDADGFYTGDDWISISDIGNTFAGVRLTLPTYLEVEARHLVVLASFMEESDTSMVTAQGVENPFDKFRVSEGAELSQVEAIEAVRQMLREEGWCRLVDRPLLHPRWLRLLRVRGHRSAL
jgi:hypothetical protein